MILGQVFSSKSVKLNLESEDKDELFEEMVQLILESQPSLNRDQILASLHEREAMMSTGIMHEIAVPHAKCDGLEGCVGAIGISRLGVDYDSLDGAPVHYVFMLVCSSSSPNLHLKVLKELAGVVQNPAFIAELNAAASPEDVYDLVCRYGAALE